MRQLYRYAIAYATLTAGPLALLLYAMRRRPKRTPGTLHIVLTNDGRSMLASIERAQRLANYYAGLPPRFTLPRRSS